MNVILTFKNHPSFAILLIQILSLAVVVSRTEAESWIELEYCRQDLVILKQRDKFKVNPKNLENCFETVTVGGEIYERLVKERLRYATEEANLLQDIQKGFRRERNTVDNLIRMQRDIIHALDNGKVMIAVFLDVKGAFDNLVHRQILEGLSKAKINRNLMKFTLSYLSDRKIVVIVGQERSEEIGAEKGVPQGSVLGPDIITLENLISP
ncbi:hypothetical protein QYM36_003180 [Artemia franciscana]|uniref:Reverse transcriptase domain-containing protein n=1 Tax=Artemia franciscana TaxID=6661 RepID=A0AA88I7S9_ARTSF|nr:hypothetical protein QYM36_003180 [Artemia franciscana]